MMTRNIVFKSARAPLVTAVVWGALVLIACCCFTIMQHGGAEQLFAIVLAAIAAILLWMWLITYYEIDGKNVWYRSGPVNGVIAISDIRTVIMHKSLYAGLKPALGSKGCIIKYNKFDEIYFSPKELERFVAELVKINPAIEVLNGAASSSLNNG
jgi:hypothetical protein